MNWTTMMNITTESSELGKRDHTSRQSGLCVVCGKTVADTIYDDLRDLEYGSLWRGRIGRCVGCGLIQQSPMLTEEQAIAFYPENYVHYNAKPTPVRSFLMKIFMRRTISLLKSLGAQPGMKLLDIGCGGGEKLAIIRDSLGLQVEGVEPNSRAAETCRETFNINTKAGFFCPKDYPPGSFDFVRINHVIEHVPEPTVLVEDIYTVLKPGGFLIGETENIDCPSFRIFGRFWSFLHLPFHLLFFEERTLKNVFVKTSFKTVALRYVTDPAAWSLSVQNYLRRDRDVRVLPERMRGYLLLTLICVPISWLEGVFSRGPVVEFRARK